MLQPARMSAAWRHTAALATAFMAGFIQQQAAKRAAAISVLGQQPFMAQQSSPAGALTPALGMHAAAAVLKCLPYELPAMTAMLGSIPSRCHLWATPGAPAVLGAAKADLYGANIEAGVASRPLLAYQPPGAAAAPQTPLQASSTTCTAISGAHFASPRSCTHDSGDHAWL